MHVTPRCRRILIHPQVTQCSLRSRTYKEVFISFSFTFFFTNPEADKLRGLKKKVNDVTDIMKGNIEKVMDRGEKLEDLEDQTDVLRVNFYCFQR